MAESNWKLYQETGREGEHLFIWRNLITEMYTVTTRLGVRPDENCVGSSSKLRALKEYQEKRGRKV